MARDINDIERDIQHTREKLARTLDELANRTKPQNLVDDAKAQATDKLNDPTVQKVLIGAGVAVVALIGLAVANSRKKKNELKELQRLLSGNARP
ncbi:DUF3618 domain-containing protein [Corynebacterium cystitidis]|uniref:DUF3618 domain-containing protein n=1 Tax=Corynebacterium cystitidis DSM 20524 TaxID=1121357 RepID=A0A1H9SJF2_9CORY|nr:DUF3618 domain-containing protein [Corynebacterium cystitidis]WJY83067.1 hypothetical protein CCYS_10835 [Corynebacterium cystitidis DSM 20524]SER85081.1 Protein of unknown function [Corynebacterium cystitidis DSM 20524]SNV65773.1 Protein of uncharacterised function (DUF3618) [Corynebacterium cystitidis]